MKKIRLTILLAIFSIPFLAQEKRADNLANHDDFAEAARLYKKAAHKHPSQQLFYKLGECYRKMNNYEEALNSYTEVNNFGPFPDSRFYLTYGLLLKNNNRYDLAKVEFKKYDSLMPSDTIGKMYLNSCDIVTEDHKWDLPIKLDDVKGVNSVYSDFGAVPYKNGIVFTSTRREPMFDKIIDGWTGGYYQDIYYAKKDTVSGEFGMPVVMEENMIDLHFHDGPAFFSKNYDSIYISRTRYDLPKSLRKDQAPDRIKIYSAKMGEYKWSGMTPLSLNSNNYSVAYPFISSDGSKLYFSSDMPGGFGGSDIYVCNREKDGWSSPVNLGPAVNTSGREIYPVLDSAGNLYFSSDGYAGFGGLDICVSLQKNGAFSKAIPMKYPFNSVTDDFGIAFLKNGRSGYISSNRGGGTGNDDIYHFDLDRDNMDKSVSTSIYTIGYRPNQQDTIKFARVNVSVYDFQSSLPLDSGTVSYVNIATKSDSQLVFSKGLTQFKLPGNSNWLLTVSASGYYELEDTLRVGKLINDTIINRAYSLAKFQSAENSQPVEKNQEPLSNQTSFSNINFDFDNYDIRPDALGTLDQVAQYMLLNPIPRLEISGYADCRGTFEYNIALSEKRAEASLKYLTSKGVSRLRIKTKGYGYEHPLNNCVKNVECSEDQYEVNRRVEFKLIQPVLFQSNKDHSSNENNSLTLQ